MQVLLVALLAATPSVAQTSQPPLIEGRRIVVLRHDVKAHAATLRRLAAARRDGDREAFLSVLAARQAAQRPNQDRLVAVVESAGAQVVDRLWLIDALVVEGASAALDELLSDHPLVERIERDRVVEYQLEQAIDEQHHDAISAHAIDLDGVKLKGGGLHIAVIDSGIDLDMGGTGRPHATFYPDGDPTKTTGGGIGGSRILTAVDLVLTDGVDDAEDVNGHGTAMAAVLGGADFSSLPDIADGVAPEAKLRIWKIGSDDAPSGVVGSAMITAFNQVAADPDIRAANMSTSGAQSALSTLNGAIDATALSGVFVAVAGGNSGPVGIVSHGCYNAIVSAASLERMKSPVDIPGFFTSAIGPLPDGRRYPHLLGQGMAVSCAWQDTETEAGGAGGTSSGSAFIAGAALLVTQARPESTQLEVKALLLGESVPSDPGGNPDAAGYGYLHVKSAVDAALAGRVVSEAIAGQTRVFHVELGAAEQRTFALTWNRELTSSLDVANLDLEIRDPNGAVVASSASAVDNVELIRFQAQTAGVHEVRVFAASGTALPVTFALAGASEPSVEDGLGCPGGPPTITNTSATTVPSLVIGLNQITLTGCSFFGVHTVTLGGVDVESFEAVDNTTLIVDLPKAPALGALPLEVTSFAGSGVVLLDVVAPEPTLILHNSALFSGQNADFTLGSDPADALVLAVSLDPTPTSFPGLLDLALGGAGTSLGLVATPTVPAAGWLNHSVPVTLTGLPPLTNLYFQAAAVPATPSFPLATTGTDSAPFVF